MTTRAALQQQSAATASKYCVSELRNADIRSTKIVSLMLRWRMPVQRIGSGFAE